MTNAPATLQPMARKEVNELRATLTFEDAVSMIQEGTKAYLDRRRQRLEAPQSAAEVTDDRAAIGAGFLIYINSPFADPAASTLKNAPPDKALNILALQWGDAEIQEFARRVSTAAGLTSKV